MRKNLLAAVLAVLCVTPAMAASKSTGIQCSPPVLQVPSDPAEGVSQYFIECGSDGSDLAPRIRYSGEIPAHGTAPYEVLATYVVDGQSEHARRVGAPVREDQSVSGVVKASTMSVATLPAQFAAQTVWDASSGTLSIEETAGNWHVYSVSYVDSSVETSIRDAGMASTPVRNGQAHARLTFGSKYSRFAGKSASDLPVMAAELRLRDGQLEVMYGETREAAQTGLQGALLRLDRAPKDMSRAWSLAARAQFLGLEDEVRYAEQKVAAHHPNLLTEFQQSVRRIKPLVANQ